MKFVIEHYGKFMLEAIVVTALMILIFCGMTDAKGNKGIFAVTGEHISVNSVDYQAYSDFKETYKTESEKNVPKITFTSGRLTLGVHMLSNYIKATDHDGNKLMIKVSSIKAPDGTEILDTYNHSTTEIVFSQEGIYLLTISALDEGNRLTKTTIQVPVNGY